MLRCKSWWLYGAAMCVLLAAVPVRGASDGQAREVSIPGTGLAIRVPLDVAVSTKNAAHPGGRTLSVSVEALKDFPRNGVVIKAEILAQRAALAKGQAKVVDGGGGEAALAEVVKLSTGGHAVIYPEYSEFEACDLRLAMVAVFFQGDQRITLRYSIPPAAVIAEDPTFFGHDTENCGPAAVWLGPGPELFQRFHRAAKAGNLGPAANAWYADFTALLGTLRQKVPTSS